jgi:hypothetical protein
MFVIVEALLTWNMDYGGQLVIYWKFTAVTSTKMKAQWSSCKWVKIINKWSIPM